MLRMLGCVGGVLLVAGGVIVLLIVILLSPFAALAPTGPVGNLRQQQQALMQAAQLLQAHLSGVRANQYTQDDPVMQPVYRFWIASCGKHGTICAEAVSGNLQCVEFVTAVFFLAGLTLPAVGNAVDFWPLYQNRAGWNAIPATEFAPNLRGLPQPGDIMVWKGEQFGHVAIVIAVVPPHDGHDGSVTVAQANAVGNRWDAQHRSDPGNWYSMPLHSDLSVSTWPGFIVRGYLRQQFQSSSVSPDHTFKRFTSDPGITHGPHPMLTAFTQKEQGVFPMVSFPLLFPFIQFHLIVADIGTAFGAVAALIAGFLSGVLAFMLVVNGYLYLTAADDVQRGMRAKAAIGSAIAGGILVATAVNFAPDLVTAFSK